jgi:hypothetical protein
MAGLLMNWKGSGRNKLQHNQDTTVAWRKSGKPQKPLSGQPVDLAKI